MNMSVVFAGVIKPLLWLLPILVLVAFFRLPAVKGWFGERRVARRGQRTLPESIYRPYHDIMLRDDVGTTQIDHVYVSVFGVFVVETKHMSGWIFGMERDAQWTQVIYRKKSRFQNPLMQNVRHAKALESLLQLPPTRFHSLVVFTGDAKFKTAMPANVCTLQDFDSYIRSFGETELSQQDVDALCRKIERNRLASTRATRKSHVADLKRRHGAKAPGRERSSSMFRNAMDAGLGIVLLKFLVGLVIVLSLTGTLKSVLKPFQNLFNSRDSTAEPRNPMPQKTLAVDTRTPP